MSILEVQGLRKAFGGPPAVDDVSFAMAPGETVALLGPSGCGKTTTLRIIAGFTSPDKGNVVIRGGNVTTKRPYERNIGILFQDYALFPHMTVEENIAFGPRHRGLSRADADQRVRRYLALVHMEQFAGRYPSTLSGGQQQRVALARALATEPEILLLDEPLSALDAKMREGLRGELKRILAETGLTTIVVTHDQEEALSLADRVMVMHKGRILQDDAPREIYNRPANRFVAEFVGRSNWLAGRVSSVGGDAVFIGQGDIAFRAPPHLPVGQDVLCFVRPENISVASADEPTPAEVLSLGGTVHSVIFLGQDTELIADVGGTLMTALVRQRSIADLQRNAPVRLLFEPGHLGLVQAE